MRFWVLVSCLLVLTHQACADIKLVAQGSVTGQDATTGEQLVNGAQAAVDAINENGGLLGQKLVLEVQDDACDPKQGVAVANQLGGSGAFAVIGPTCSGTAIPASKIFNEEGIIMISPSATNPVLTEQKLDNVFRTCGRDDQQGQAIADYILKTNRDGSIAIIDDKTAYGHGIAEEVKRALNKGGVTERTRWSVTRGERDYASLIAKLKENTTSVVFFGGYHTEAGLIVRQMRDAGMSALFLGDDDLTTREFWSITGSAGESAMMSFNPDPRKLDVAADAVRRIRARGFEPEGLTLYAYAAVQVLSEAIRKANTLDENKVIARLHYDSFPSVVGDLTFDAHGDVTAPGYIMYRWSQGNYAPIP